MFFDKIFSFLWTNRGEAVKYRSNFSFLLTGRAKLGIIFKIDE